MMIYNSNSGEFKGRGRTGEKETWLGSAAHGSAVARAVVCDGGADGGTDYYGLYAAGSGGQSERRELRNSSEDHAV